MLDLSCAVVFCYFGVIVCDDHCALAIWQIASAWLVSHGVEGPALLDVRKFLHTLYMLGGSGLL